MESDKLKQERMELRAKLEHPPEAGRVKEEVEEELNRVRFCLCPQIFHLVQAPYSVFFLFFFLLLHSHLSIA
jgi:hypothetical protein